MWYSMKKGYHKDTYYQIWFDHEWNSLVYQVFCNAIWIKISIWSNKAFFSILGSDILFNLNDVWRVTECALWIKQLSPPFQRFLPLGARAKNERYDPQIKVIYKIQYLSWYL